MSRLLVTNKSFELLEPYEGKLSRTVLRGESSRKGADLLDNKGDKVELLLPMQPRFIKANPAVETLKDMATIASGPIVYCLEGCDNQDLSDLKLNTNIPMSMGYSSELLKGINVIKGKALDAKGQEVTVSAIPYYAVGNREEGEPYKVWIPVK